MAQCSPQFLRIPRSSIAADRMICSLQAASFKTHDLELPTVAYNVQVWSDMAKCGPVWPNVAPSIAEPPEVVQELIV